MHLLVTNDDGVDSVFLKALVCALRKVNHTVYVVAPAFEQSWIGAAKSRHRAVRSLAGDFGLNCPTWTVDGTPSDCVNIALAHLLPRLPDAVISGINMGFNASLGFMFASGTIGGAWEGVTHGLRALAVSQDLPKSAFEELKQTPPILNPTLAETLGRSASHLAAHAEAWLMSTPPRQYILHNVNYPYESCGQAAVVRTVPARTFVPRLFSPQMDDGTHRFVFALGEEESLSPDSKYLSDRECLRRGLISHTVLDYSKIGVPEA